MLAIATSCATTQHEQFERPLAVGDPCPHERYIEFLDGARLVEIKGRFVSRDDSGVTHPIRSGRLVYWHLRDDLNARHPETHTDRSGNFSAMVAIPWSKKLTCENGRIVGVATLGQEKLIVRARSCRDTVISVDQDWSAHDIELSCDRVQRSGEQPAEADGAREARGGLSGCARAPQLSRGVSRTTII